MYLLVVELKDYRLKINFNNCLVTYIISMDK